MKTFIKYPTIGKPINTQQDLKHTVNKDKDTDYCIPSLTFSLTEKGHGTNAAVCYNKTAGIWVQSRNRFISPHDDNAGCAFAVEQHIETWLTIIEKLATEYRIDLTSNSIYLYGEWIGGNIQSNSALGGLEKHYMLFEYFGVASIGTTYIDRWLPTNGTEAPKANIINVTNYFYRQLIIDFNDLEDYTDYFKVIVDDIEKSSPLGEAFGVTRIGEGIVGSTLFMGELYQFKVKGLEHTRTNKMPKQQKQPISNYLIDIAYKVVPEWRLEQIHKEVCPNAADMRDIGGYIKAVIRDIKKEEQDVFNDEGITFSSIGAEVTKIIKQYYMNCIKGGQNETTES